MIWVHGYKRVTATVVSIIFSLCQKEYVIWVHGYKIWVIARDKKGWTQRVGLANVSPKGLYHVMRG